MNQIKPRHPLMAALMSTILPGFGQLYNGTVNRGLLVFMAFTLVVIPLVLWVALYLPTQLTLPLLILTIIINVCIWLYGIIDAWKTAKKSSHYTPKNWQIPGVYLMVFLAAMLFFIPGISQFIRSNQVESFYIPSASMQPTLLKGDVLFANKSYNCPNCLKDVKRGDIAIFVYPNNRTQNFIKRIIALPGDRVSIREQQIFVNGKSLKSGDTQQRDNMNIINEKTDNAQYQVQWSADDKAAVEEFVVPNGEAFVLGDNRSNSNDSRFFGTVPLRDVVGKASQIWWSRYEGEFRWKRFGLVLK